MADIFGGIKKSGDVLKQLAIIFGSLLLVAVIFFIIMGVFSDQADSGNLPVDNDTVNDIDSMQSNYSSIVDTIVDNAGIAIAFIVLGIVVLVAMAFLGKGAIRGGSGKGGSGSSDF